MQVGDIVELKSGGPKMRVDWEIGVTPTPPNHPYGEINDIVRNSTGYDTGDNSCEWSYRSKPQKKVFPQEALIIDTNNLIPASNQILTMGCVVLNNKDNQTMTVNWVVGANCRPPQLLDVDQILTSQGFQNGDVSCLWFKGGKLHEGVFNPYSLTKIFD